MKVTLNHREHALPTFAWKIVDGDSRIPNTKMKIPVAITGGEGNPNDAFAEYDLGGVSVHYVAQKYGVSESDVHSGFAALKASKK